MGKGRRAIEEIGKKQESCKAGIVTTRIQKRSHCMPFRRSKAKAAGEESSSSVAGLGQQAGSRKKLQSQSGRKQQDSSSRPRRVCQHAGIP